jgi:[acyl-carrier-protein] S-malonyltransferase
MGWGMRRGGARRRYGGLAPRARRVWMPSCAQGAAPHRARCLLTLPPPGPAARLDDTEVAQPALLVADLAAAALLEARDPGAAGGAGAAAGLSLGEYAALVWAGAMDFEDALKVGARCGRANGRGARGGFAGRGWPLSCPLPPQPAVSDSFQPCPPPPPAAALPPKVVKVRAEAMAAAARAGGRPHGMLSVVGVPDAELEALCRDAAAKAGAGTVCGVANKLFPTVRRGGPAGAWGRGQTPKGPRHRRPPVGLVY